MKTRGTLFLFCNILVDPAVPSCTEGLFLSLFLPPTPANGAQPYTPVGQTLEISIKAEATNSMYVKEKNSLRVL